MKTKHFLLTWLLGWLMVMPIATMAQEPHMRWKTSHFPMVGES